jgi:hypothetical protein
MSNGAIPGFQYDDGGAGGGLNDMFGLWLHVSDAAPGSTLSFALDAEGETARKTEEGVPVWRVNLPSDYEQAAAYLRAGEAKLRATEEALAAANDRLESFVASRTTAAMPFGISTESTESDAELESLLLTLRGDHPVVSFGLADNLQDEWSRTSEQFQNFINQLQRIVANYAWVETSVEGDLLSRTVVSWTGDVNTFWARENFDPALVELHQHTLKLALTSRDVLVRTLVVVLEGVIKFSILISTGVGVLALPAMWKSVRKILAQIEALQQLEKTS